jgi:superfamily I DNA/RNA helicase
LAFDFGRANDQQKEAIQAVDGPLLIIAGPGTGKTYTLVQRAAYLIEEKGVRPENILMATFTEKAAKELITRISSVLLEKNPGININDMYIGTFHSICLRFIKDNIDEYQDTNHIQKKIVFLLAGLSNNICVVGDDDQGLYRFRGATIRNIIEFPSHFTVPRFKSVKLTVNYRSNSDIVSFYNDWMENPTAFDWANFRFEKKTEPSHGNINGCSADAGCSADIRVTGNKSEETWHENIQTMINALLDTGKVKNLNQI